MPILLSAGSKLSRAFAALNNAPATEPLHTSSPADSNTTTMAPGSNSKQRDYDYLFKLVLIGDSGVGKSCLLLRFAVRKKCGFFFNRVVPRKQNNDKNLSFVVLGCARANRITHILLFFLFLLLRLLLLVSILHFLRMMHSRNRIFQRLVSTFDFGP